MRIICRVSLNLEITDSARLAGQGHLESQLLCRHWRSELRFSRLHSKSFTHWAISPAPSCIFYKCIRLRGINSEGYLHHNIHPDLANSVLFSLNPWGNQAVRICKGYLKIEARVVILKRSEQPRPMGEWEMRPGRHILFLPRRLCLQCSHECLQSDLTGVQCALGWLLGHLSRQWGEVTRPSALLAFLDCTTEFLPMISHTVLISRQSYLLSSKRSCHRPWLALKEGKAAACRL